MTALSDDAPGIVLTGAARLVLDPSEKTADPSAFLRVRKSRKFMGTQDDLAVVATGRALTGARIKSGATVPADRIGLYAVIGFIPFERADIDPVLAASLDGEGAFDVQRFNAEGYLRAHPLITFRCLPNMPAYHVSVNFGVEGPYFVTYPGAGQTCLALDEARRAIANGSVDVALVVATAHQRNFLVEHHHARLDHPVAPDALRDAACTLVLEREDHARARGADLLARLLDVDVGYAPFDPLEGDAKTAGTSPIEYGAAAPLLAILDRLNRHSISDALVNWRCSLSVAARDGILGSSSWSAP